MILQYFLGANGAGGFQSLYEPFVAPEENRDILVLKGGPGAGKSTFMKYLGKKAEEAGEDVEYIWCSGDPESLDAVRLPRVGVIAVDGTSPHVVEPQYPAAVDRYINLGQFYDVAACKARRAEIISHTTDYKAAYQRAYHALGASAAVGAAIRDAMSPGLDRERLCRRLTGIAVREFGKKNGEKGKTTFRYLGGPTCQGVITRFDTVKTLCPRIYEIRDSYGLSAEVMQFLHRAAVAAGYDTVACPDPDWPKAILHLLIPKLGLAFVTLGEKQRFPGETYRRFHLDHLVDEKCQSRARLRFTRRVRQALLEEGIAALGEAKASHDKLEAVYNPAVDFSGVYALAAEEWARIRGYL